jgi:hypothetical protein
MRSNSAVSSFFMTVTDIKENTHVKTVFFSSLLELQLNEERVRTEYKDDQFIVMTHPSKEAVRSNELNDVFHQARMQSLIMRDLQQQRTR